MSARLRLLDHRDPSLPDLRRHGSAPVLVTDGHSLSYDELADRVDERAAQLGPTRRLVMLGCRNDVETVVTYLAAQQARHPVLLTDGDVSAPALRRATTRYEPDVVAAGDTVEERRPGTRHRLHEDLALLMSTSGSTGSPKLVRLSHENLRANADSIATYLSITPDDRAATTLPLHYCYGLSVLNSHLLVGASLLVTERSVVDDEFWDDFEDLRATVLRRRAAHVRPARRRRVRGPAPALTALRDPGRRSPRAGAGTALRGTRTSARLRSRRDVRRRPRPRRGWPTCRRTWPRPGRRRSASRPGRVAPHRHRVSERTGRRRRARLHRTQRDARLRRRARDLAAGRACTELRTGDLARQRDDGIFELVGRSNRFAKIFGLRIDLDRVERIAAERRRRHARSSTTGSSCSS